MRGLSRTQKLLSKALLDLDEEAMLLEVLDGFIAGVLVCPEMIPPSVWLPLVWNGQDGEPAFENVTHANRVMGLVMEHYNGVARARSSKRLATMHRPSRSTNATVTFSGSYGSRASTPP